MLILLLLIFSSYVYLFIYVFVDYEYWQTPLSINTRNGSSKKTVKSSIGELEINIPRDRDASFEPQILKKYDKDISNIDAQIISMYSKGMTTRYFITH